MRLWGRREVLRSQTHGAVQMWWFTPRWFVVDEDETPPAGPWDNEPDKIQWVDAQSDYDCLMLRSAGMGNWCGYVGVPPTHRLFGSDYHEMYDAADEAGHELRVHGGLTFADSCTPDEPIDGICHVPAPGRVRSPWWFGFDCQHFDDLAPGMTAYMDRFELTSPTGAIYRDVTYVMTECAGLAAQLKLIA